MSFALKKIIVFIEQRLVPVQNQVSLATNKLLLQPFTPSKQTNKNPLVKFALSLL